MALTKFNFNSFDLTTSAGSGLGFNSSANALSAIGAGAMTHIKTLTASGDSTLSFVDGSSSVVLDNTYPVYLFKFINVHPSADQSAFQFNASVDSGSNYNSQVNSTFFYLYHRGSDAHNFFGYDTGRDLANNTHYQSITFNANVDNYSSGNGFIYLFNPSSTTFATHFLTVSNEDSQTSGEQGLSQQVFTGGYFNTTSAVDAIQFKYSSGNIDAGTIKLYGIKDS